MASVTVRDEPGACEITVVKGKDYQKSFAFQDSTGAAMDLTGYTGYAQARTSERASSTLLLDFTVTHNDTGGIVTISADRDDTDPSLIDNSAGVWSLVLVSPTDFAKTYIKDVIYFTDDPTELT